MRNRKGRLRLFVVAAGVGAVASSALAVASPSPATRYGASYSPTAQGNYQYAPVTHVEPIIRQVRIETPRRECWDEARYVESRPHISDPAVGGRTLLGSIIGGVVGHQFGSGRGRDAATLAGAAIGAGVGYDSAAKRYSPAVRQEVVQRCEVNYRQEYEERIEGYRVSYRVDGRDYDTQLPYDPGERIRVRVSVVPAP